MLVGMGWEVQILGCSDHAGESVPPDPMRTGSSRVAHDIAYNEEHVQHASN
jgi:hypothetical protein